MRKHIWCESELSRPPSMKPLVTLLTFLVFPLCLPSCWFRLGFFCGTLLWHTDRMNTGMDFWGTYLHVYFDGNTFTYFRHCYWWLKVKGIVGYIVVPNQHKWHLIHFWEVLWNWSSGWVENNDFSKVCKEKGACIFKYTATVCQLQRTDLHFNHLCPIFDLKLSQFRPLH